MEEEKVYCSPSESIHNAGDCGEKDCCHQGQNGISVESDLETNRVIIALVVNGQKMGCALSANEAAALNQAINACIFEVQSFEKV